LIRSTPLSSTARTRRLASPARPAGEAAFRFSRATSRISQFIFVMHVRTITSRLRNESGQAAVEFALVFAFALVPLLFLMVGVGRAFDAYNDLNQMAADGARFAAVGNFPGGPGLLASSADTNATRTAAVCGPIYLAVADPTPGKGAACPPAGTCAVGKRVWIRTTATVGFAPMLSMASKQVEGKAEMRVERCPTP
jgi:Flp pilus assembly pilin Flp